MGTSASTPTVEIKVTRTMTKLAGLEEVSLAKVESFSPVASAGEALEQLGGDTAAFLRIVNEGLRIEKRNQLLRDNTKPWFEQDEDGEIASEPFTEKIVDSAAVSKLIMTFAQLRGYNASLPKDQKKAIKEAAKAFVKANAETMLQDAVGAELTPTE